MLTAALALVTMWKGCAVEHHQDSELLQAERTARCLTAPRYLHQSMYASTHEEDAPSESIFFFFQRWARPNDHRSVMRPRWSRNLQVPLACRCNPVNVAAVPLNPDLQERKQIVLKSDDANGTIIAEAYMSPDLSSAFTSKWPMPTFREKN